MVTVASNIAYLPFGPITSLDIGNGLTTTLAYDQDYRLTDLDTADGGTVVQDLDYTYGDINGDAGNIRIIDDNLAPARDQAFDYDAVYRLTEAIGAYGDIDYVWDAVGNRTSRVVTTSGTVTETLTYDTLSNRLLTVADGSTTRTLGYTANGHVTSDSRGLGFDYLYNHADRLATLQENSIAVASYTHNDIGERVIKDVGGTVTHFVFDAAGILIAEASGAGVTAREYIHLDGLPLGTVVGTTLYYVHPDHLGAPQKITDALKAVVWDGQFTPFGVEHSITGALTANWRMPGQYHDAEAALSYNYRRTYDPALGRYLQSDPIGLTGGLNTYAYAHSSPVMLTDPTGEVPLLIPVAAVGFVGGQIILRVAISYNGKTVVRWLTQAFLAGIVGLWAHNNIDWQVIDAAVFGFTVPERDSAADNGFSVPPPFIPPEMYNKPPKDASDPEGAKAPGEPGEAEGFKHPKKGSEWVRNPNGPGKGWLDDKGRVWIPTGHGGSAYGGPHWDVQFPGRDRRYKNVKPGQHIDNVPLK